MKRMGLFVNLFFFFMFELVKANWDVFRLIFKGRNFVRPAIIRVPIELKSDAEILLLANMITLTPGTLTLEVSSDRKALFVHAIHTDSVDETVKSIKVGFEARIQELFK
jgi:multicomponent Na+:H+ antiporter subunit E